MEFVRMDKIFDYKLTSLGCPFSWYSKFIRDKYGSSPEEAAYFTGAIYLISILSPVVGYAIVSSVLSY